MHANDILAIARRADSLAPGALSAPAQGSLNRALSLLDHASVQLTLPQVDWQDFATDLEGARRELVNARRGMAPEQSEAARLIAVELFDIIAG